MDQALSAIETAPDGVRRARRGRAPGVWRRRLPRWVATAALALTGATLGLLLGGTVAHRVGPVDATFRLRLAASGGTRVDVPPLGRLVMASHHGPLRLVVDVTEVRADAVRRLLTEPPDRLDALTATMQADVRSAIETLAVRSLLSAVGGAVVLTALGTRRGRATLAGGALALVAVAGAGGLAAGTFRSQALSEPRFSGLLAGAPAAVGDVRDIQARFTAYRDEIGKLVTNVSKLYGVTTTLPSLPPDADTIRLLWVSDLHDNPEGFDVLTSVAEQFRVDLVVDTGDISDHGTRLENRFYAPLARLTAPYVFVKGNHDATGATLGGLRRYPGVQVVDGNVHTVAGLAVAGIGDPRFTPDRTRHTTTAAEEDLLRNAGTELATNIDVEPPRADIALVHDPVSAEPLFGHVPLVLAGHLHHRERTERDGTLLLVQGSTGGAGLRGLEGDEPTPLELSVLYLSRSTHRLVAYDDITVGGLGLTSARIERHAVTP